jgi:hypothetical protein
MMRLLAVMAESLPSFREGGITQFSPQGRADRSSPFLRTTHAPSRCASTGQYVRRGTATRPWSCSTSAASFRLGLPCPCLFLRWWLPFRSWFDVRVCWWLVKRISKVNDEVLTTAYTALWGFVKASEMKVGRRRSAPVSVSVQKSACTSRGQCRRAAPEFLGTHRTQTEDTAKYLWNPKFLSGLATVRDPDPTTRK